MANKEKPNIVFILTDQWRAQATGYAGDPNVKTPNLDALAQKSIRLDTTVSTCPVCCPARACLLTGQYPLTHGIFLNQIRLEPDTTTFAEVLKSHGYDTAYIGKWHLDGDTHEQNFIPPERRLGFDFWRAHECSHNYYDSPYYDDSGIMKKWEGYDAFAQTDCAIEYLEGRQNEDDPFFLFVSYGPPHNPFHKVPEEYRALYNEDEIVLRDNVPAECEAIARNDMWGYYAHITALDHCVGRVEEALERLGMTEGTILVFTSDHGEMNGSQGHDRKIRPWDESMLVPFLLRLPNGIGRQIDTPFGIPDMMPTLLDLVGAPVPEGVEGVSFAKHMLGEADAPLEASLFGCYVPFANYSYEHGGREYRGVRTSRYTYVRDLEGPWLLYDNEADPYQLENLCGRPEVESVQTHLEGLLSDLLKEHNDAFENGQELLDRWGYEIVNPHAFRRKQV